MRITGGSWFAVAVGRSSRDVELHGRALGIDRLDGWMTSRSDGGSAIVVWVLETVNI